MRFAAALLLACAPAIAHAADAAGPKTDDQKTLYTLGFFLGSKAAPLSITPAELKWVDQGFKEGASNKKPAVDVEAFGPKVNELAMARTKKQRDAAAAEEAKSAQGRKEAEKEFLAKAAAEKGAQKFP